MLNNHRYRPSSITHGGIRSALTDEQLRKLEAASRRRSFKAGELIFKEGDKPAHTFAVISGALKLTKVHPDGEEHIIGLMFADDLLCGTFKPRHTCSAEAATDLELCAIPVETLSGLLDEAPQLERVLFQAALTEHEAYNDWMLLLRGCTAYQRVAGFLGLLAKRVLPKAAVSQNDGSVPVQFTLPLSRAEIAGFLDITIETVSRQLTLMKKKSVIELPSSRDSREVIVPDVWRLGAQAVNGFSGSEGPAMLQ